MIENHPFFPQYDVVTDPLEGIFQTIAAPYFPEMQSIDNSNV